MKNHIKGVSITLTPSITFIVGYWLSGKDLPIERGVETMFFYMAILALTLWGYALNSLVKEIRPKD